MTFGVKCPKCGLWQLPSPSCKCCGMGLDPSPPSPLSSSRLVPGPVTSTPVSVQSATPLRSSQGLLTFHGAGGPLFSIYIINVLLTIVTCGIYYFWGKVKVQNYLLNQTEIEGDRFAFHATGKELLIGFLKAVLIFVLPSALLNTLPELMGAAVLIKWGAAILAYGIIMVFIPIAMVGARRFRFSRTSWRGIRFSFRGQAWEFVRLFTWGLFLTAMTLGIYYPVFDTRRYGFFVSHSYFGNRQFRFNGNWRELFGAYLLTLALTLPTLGLCWFWYMARKQRFFWAHTFFGSARFRYDVTGRALLNFHLGNLLLLVVTLGVALPWIMIRKIHFVSKYLALEGALDVASIRQEVQKASATVEALAGFVGAGFDVG
jgi:uncharacterized membrane protein YjgN (DUF898 family)